MIPVSVVLITHNEAERLEELLPLLSAFSEVVILDSNSTDATHSVVKAFPNVAIYQQDFQGFGKQKQDAVQYAKHDWILSLDADELPNSELIAHIQSLRAATDQPALNYTLRRKLVFLGKTFHYGKESRDEQLRFFNRNTARWTADAVHEKVLSDVPIGRLNGFALHKSYRNLDNYIGKFNRYTSLAAEAQFAKGKKSALLFIPFRGIFTFFRSYIMQLNLLNGFSGWLWSLFAAVYTVVKYTKLYELHRRNR